MGLLKDRGQFSLQSIKSQRIRHGSLSSVDSSSFPIVWDGKSPSCLSGEWRAPMSVLRVWMAQKTRTRSESGPSTNAHLHGEQEFKSWRFLWLFELIEGFWWKFHCMHLAVWDKIKLSFTDGFGNSCSITNISIQLAFLRSHTHSDMPQSFRKALFINHIDQKGELMERRVVWPSARYLLSLYCASNEPDFVWGSFIVSFVCLSAHFQSSQE